MQVVSGSSPLGSIKKSKCIKHFRLVQIETELMWHGKDKSYNLRYMFIKDL